MVPLSLFSKDGLDVGAGTRNMNYLYGLADFFAYTFEDTETVNVMLEAGAVGASEIYSKFLQLTSSLTLSGIQVDTGATIKLVLLKESEQSGSSPKYLVKTPISYAKYLANKPFLPTELLEEGVDFRVSQIDQESCYVQFAKPLDQYRFSRRPTSTGDIEYAIWAIDTILDEQLMYNYYGKLLGVSPEVSSDQFSNFIYGLYYLYLNGPSLRVMEQGLNLVLGIPLVRESSTVLDIRLNVESGQYIIITDLNQYIIPSGITPSVNLDDQIDVGTPLAKWVELKDYTSSGSWWINVSIPSSLIRHTPSNQTDRFARPGNGFDYLMSNFLRRNTFLVRINIGTFNTSKYFSYLSDILTNAKPAYTQPIYIWRLTSGDETVLLDIEELSFSMDSLVSSMDFINSNSINDICIN